jgi:uncharacterized membrane protein
VNDSRPTERLENHLAILLEYGTWLACAVIAVGLLLTSVVMTESVVGTALVKTGIGLIILLPMLRVAMMLGLFAKDRNYHYTAIALTVLLIIAAGFVIGLRS